VRVGIWCAYGKTLEFTDGIGVFAHLLARHLVGDPRVSGVDLLIHAGDAPLVAETVAAGGGRIRVVEQARLGVWGRWRRKRARWQHRRIADRLAAGSLSHKQQQRFETELRDIESSVARILELQAVSDPYSLSSPHDGGCDIWVLPHVSVERRFRSASVVLIHDMVPLREPGLIKPHDLASFRRRSQAVAERSTLIGCMSNVIRDEDIVCLLDCPQEKVRVVRPAVPDDIRRPLSLKKDADEVQTVHLPVNVTRPYLLYPAAFRPYKNHELLIDALSHFDQRGFPGLQLVFTGDSLLPPSLEERAVTHGVRDRVHAVGRVDREVLEQLYCHAEATVVPSRHEQGSFPVLEALACGCPVAVSDIPSLREAFEHLDKAVPFFNPSSPTALVNAVVTILQDPEGVRAAQMEGFERLRQRQWATVASEWVDVFAEAIDRQNAFASSTPEVCEEHAGGWHN
jgi:glycosyltransferase involved in cell wall biosynthesis